MRTSLAIALGCFLGCIVTGSLVNTVGTLNNTIGGLSWDATGETEPITSTVGAGLTPELGWLSIATGEVEPTGVTLQVLVKDPDDNEVLAGTLTPMPDEVDTLRLEPIPVAGLYHVEVTSPPGVKGQVKLLFKPSLAALGMVVLAGVFGLLAVVFITWWQKTNSRAGG